MNDYQTKLEELQKANDKADAKRTEVCEAWKKADEACKEAEVSRGKASVLLGEATDEKLEAIKALHDFKRNNRGKYERPSNS